MLTFLYKANVFAASIYASVSIFVSLNYELWLPHPVGHLFPAASVVIAAIWSLHCWQLGISRSYSQKVAKLAAALPMGLSLFAGIACWLHYRQEIAQPYKALEWLQITAA